MLCFITGTGTGIGKTHLSQALLGAAPQKAHGYKPVESGFSAECDETDAAALARASTFHVKQAGRRWLFPDPVSPHLAAERAGESLDLESVAAAIAQCAEEAPITIVELPGGLFTPLSASAANIDLALRFPSARTLLVAPNRLGVLHDVLAASTAAQARGLTLRAVLLSAPAQPDDSTPDNAAALRARLLCPIFEAPRADLSALAGNEAIRACATHLFGAA
jgi:dethiobiotin synthetase